MFSSWYQVSNDPGCKVTDLDLNAMQQLADVAYEVFTHEFQMELLHLCYVVLHWRERDFSMNKQACMQKGLGEDDAGPVQLRLESYWMQNLLSCQKIT